MATKNTETKYQTPSAKDDGVNASVTPTSETIPALSISGDEYRANFLGTFSSANEKRIMRNMEYRILFLFGFIYMVK